MRHYYYYTFIDKTGTYSRIWETDYEYFPISDIIECLNKDIGNVIITFWHEIKAEEALKYIEQKMRDMK